MDKQHITCFGCGNKGHYQSECPENENDEEEEEDVANLMVNGQGMVLMMASPTVQLPPMTWIANSGASTHITTNEECGLYKKRCINEVICLGNGKIIHATIVGKLDVMVLQAGCQAIFTLKNIQYILCSYAEILA